MNLEIYFWVLEFIFFICLLWTVCILVPALRTKTELIRSNIVGRIIFWGRFFTPYFNKILMMTEKWVDFFVKIDLCSKFGYLISKIGESPPKSSSSFPNRDPLLIAQCAFMKKLILFISVRFCSFKELRPSKKLKLKNDHFFFLISATFEMQIKEIVVIKKIIQKLVRITHSFFNYVFFFFHYRNFLHKQFC